MRRADAARLRCAVCAGGPDGAAQAAPGAPAVSATASAPAGVAGTADRTESAAPVPAAAPSAGFGGTRPSGSGEEGSDPQGAQDSGRGRPPGPAWVLGSVRDALWRSPGGRPQGPVRLFHGPSRPAEGRIVAGVCAGLARGSQPMTITLRVVFPLFSFPLGLLVYLLLWMLLPRDDEVPDDSAQEGAGRDGGGLPPVQPREVTAWFLLLGVSGGLSALVAVQLAQFHRLDPVLAIVLGFAVGLPFALLPVAPLLTWRMTAAGLFAVLAAIGLGAPPVPAGAAGAAPYELWPWPVAALLALPVVLYAVAVNYPGRIALGVGLVTVAADIAAASLLVGTHPGQTAWIAAVAAAVLLLGYNVRSRRAAQRRLAQETALRRRDRARQAVLEERSRIARELHDVVSHHMSMIAIQADAAPYKFADLDTGPAATFTTIRDAARDALAEMRRVVGLLREEGEVPDEAPQPGLETLPDLIESARRAAMDITLEGGAQAARAAARGLPDAVEVSAYRIVQESVSNAGRHAPGAPVAVALARTAAALTIRVENGPPPASGEGGAAAARPPATAVDSGGHGLVGMRERVAMLGGALQAERTPEGGFRVVAELPADAAGPAAD
nr:histidine kinase [Streptomonospora sp. PA3]